jgi:hypothetical protein
MRSGDVLGWAGAKVMGGSFAAKGSVRAVAVADMLEAVEDGVELLADGSSRPPVYATAGVFRSGAQPYLVIPEFRVQRARLSSRNFA